MFPEDPIAPPERVLWLAVIERAIMDYVCPTPDIPSGALLGLDSFFFDDYPRPFNLRYICDDLFDYPDAAGAVRRRVIELTAHKKRSFNRSKRYRGYY